MKSQGFNYMVNKLVNKGKNLLQANRAVADMNNTADKTKKKPVKKVKKVTKKVAKK